MGFLYVIIVVCSILFVFCMIGLALSLKRKNKESKLQAAADYNFQTKNGSYSFKYMIKGFNSETGKKIKIVVNPVLGFSDLSTSSTNKCTSAAVLVKGKKSGKAKSYNFDLDSLNPNFTVVLSQNLASEELEVHVATKWSLGGSIIDEKLSFTYSKL